MTIKDKYLKKPLKLWLCTYHHTQYDEAKTAIIEAKTAKDAILKAFFLDKEEEQYKDAKYWKAYELIPENYNKILN